MKVVEASFPSIWVDCVQALDESHCKGLKAAGIEGVSRYLGSITKTELDTIIGCGLKYLPVTFARKPDAWTPSADMGLADGALDVARMQQLSLPIGHHVAIDLEGCVGPASATAAWLDARSKQHVDAGWKSALYVGDQPGGLDHASLYARPYSTLYWKSLSRVPEPDCGWGFIQLYKSIMLAGVWCDVNVVQYDYKDRRPMVVSGDD